MTGLLGRLNKLEQWASEVANRAPSGPAWTRALHRAYGDGTPWVGTAITDEEFERALDEAYGPTACGGGPGT